MKPYKRLNWNGVFVLILFLLIISCKGDKKQDQKEVEQLIKDPVIEVITNNMEFQMPDTIPSGWNTFRYINKSTQTHFFTIEKYPEGKTLEDVKELVIPYFDSGMKFINEGKPEEGFAEFGKLPEWFSEVKILGGVALLSPGVTGETTMRLDPGNYFIECYVKMSNGVFHASVGMFDEFYVSGSNSGNTEPTADYSIELSSTDGIVLKDKLKAGNASFSVFFKDQIVHENFAGHDVNLAKIDDSADLEEIESWMNWADPKGLIEPAPKGITFLGGVNNMPAGERAYFKAILDQGKYILIAEVPNAKSKNMLKVIDVSN
ncbi:hypothetical protein [Aestuariivivens sediminicola]|uniref:hypothetical protein n=1 Tax=Aestuariivivens sediminicola TaxID=2913560 RepID=UPI001F55D814|nr:hypothetical protein [Aestuariivivens sediminicola]